MAPFKAPTFYAQLHLWMACLSLGMGCFLIFAVSTSWTYSILGISLVLTGYLLVRWLQLQRLQIFATQKGVQVFNLTQQKTAHWRDLKRATYSEISKSFKLEFEGQTLLIPRYLVGINELLNKIIEQVGMEKCQNIRHELAARNLR